MGISARQPFSARRNEARTFTLRVVGLDLTAAAAASTLKMEVRLRLNSTTSLFSLATVSTSSAEGLKLDSVVTTNGLPTSVITGRINKATMDNAAKVPFTGEAGQASRLAYAIQIDGVTRLIGDFWVLPSVVDASGEPSTISASTFATEAPEPWAASALTFSNDDIRVTIDGADQLAPLLATAGTSATAAQSAQAAAEAARDQTTAVIGTTLVYSPMGSETAVAVDTDDELRPLLSVVRATGAVQASGLAGGGTTLVAYPDMTRVQFAMLYGQSWTVRNTQTPPISTTPLSFYPNAKMPNGGVFDEDGFEAGNYTSLVSIVEVDAETPVTGMVRYALSHGAAYNPPVGGVTSWTIVGASMGKGSEKQEFFLPGGSWWTANVVPALTAMASLTASQGGEASILPWLHGGADTLSGGADKPTYKAGLKTILDSYQALNRSLFNHNRVTRMLMFQPSRNTSTIDKIALAQLEVAQEDSRVFLISPAYFLTYADSLHFTAPASKLMGCYIGRAAAEIYAGRDPLCMMPLPATRRGNVITAPYKGFVGDLQINNTDLAATVNAGFVVKDANGTVAITSVAISADKKAVVITLGATPVGATVLRYALDNRAASLPAGGGMASGNLSDSDPETVVISGVTYKMLRWAPHSQVTVTEIGE